MSASQKVAMITGAGGGIGRATALAFARAGYRTVISDLNEKGGQETVDLIKSQHNIDSSFLKTDVSKENDVKGIMKHIKDRYGRLDATFNNAGISGEMWGNAHDCTLQDWNRVISINLTGAFLCTKYEIPMMLETAGGGSIVNCSSIFGKRGFSLQPAYTASKHGLLGMTKSFALDLATKGVRCNAVCPAFIQTEMVEKVASQVEEIVKARQPIGRLGRSEEIAEAVVWLCSDAASFITGTAIDCDGGWLSA